MATSGHQIRDEELAACAETGITYDKLEVAFDGVAVVVNPANEAVACLTIEQLDHLGAPVG